MEKIKIAELTIDTNKLVSEMKTTKSEMDKLKVAQKELKDSGKENSAQFIKNAADLKTSSATYRAQEKTLQEVTGAIRGLTAELGKEVKSLAEAEANNKALRKARRDVNTTTDEGKKALNEINTKIDANTKYMKTNQDAQVKQKMNVGNYKDSVLEATGATKAYTVGTQIMNGVQAVSAMVVGKSTGALKLFRIALAATGIGLIVLALGSLVTYFLQTQEGINKVNMVLTPLKELFGELQGAIQEVGSALSKLFSGGTFKAFFSDMGNAGDKVAKSFDEAWKRGKQIETLKQNLSKTEAAYITLQAKLKKEFEEQNKLADDQTLSATERAEAAQKAIDAQAEISKGTIERIKQEGEILKLKQMSNDTSDEEKAQLATKLAEIDKALQEEASKSKEAANKLNAINKQTNDKAAADRKANADANQAARDKNIADTVSMMEQELALYEAKAEGIKRTGAEQLQYIKDKNIEELDILQYKLDKQLISETEFLTAKQGLQNQEKAAQAQIAQEELDAIEAFNQRKAELEEELYLNSLATEEERDLAKLDKKLLDEEAEIEAMKVSAEKKKELKLLLEEQYQQNLNDTQKKYGDERLAAEEKRAKEELQVKQALAESRWNIAAGLSGLLNNLAGEDAAVQKAALIFEKGVAASRVIIQTQVANAKTAAQMGAIPAIPFIIANNVMMGISLATIAAQAITGFKNINKQSSGGSTRSNRKFARGGNIFGDAHSDGGVQLEAEGGESIINKRSTYKYGGLLSAINQAEGGVPIMGGNQKPSGLIDYDLLAGKISQANMSLPSPNVSVSEINSVSGRVVEIQERAKF